MRSYLLGAALLAAAGLASGASLEDRVERLERALQNQGLPDLVLQVERLQQEVQRLRGELEMQGHALEGRGPTRPREPYREPDPRLRGPSDSQPAEPLEPPPPARVAPTRVPPGVSAADRTGPAERPALDGPGPESSPLGPADTGEGQAIYKKAFDQLRQGSYVDAINGFNAYLSQHGTGPYADNAQYWLGEAHYVHRDFGAALAEFSKVVERFPRSAKVPGALLKIGYIHYEQQNWAKARQALNQIGQSYPTSAEARLAQQRLERMRKEGR